MAQNIVWIDTETTGLDAEKNAIVQIAAIRRDGTTFMKHVRPHDGAEIVDKALEVNGLSRLQLQTFPTPQAVASELLAFLRPQAPKVILGGHNMKFDWDFLKAFFRRAGMINEFENTVHYNFLDTLPLAMALQEAGILQTTRGWLRLADLTKALGVVNVKAHDALGDIAATKECYDKMVSQLRTAFKTTQTSLL